MIKIIKVEMLGGELCIIPVDPNVEGFYVVTTENPQAQKSKPIFWNNTELEIDFTFDVRVYPLLMISTLSKSIPFTEECKLKDLIHALMLGFIAGKKLFTRF